jgi:AcrR family transcriptional regulator
MSPRPRKVSDEELLEATTRVMGKLGPSQLTLSEIGAEAGVTAGALVQRFGSKRGLLLALSSRAAEGTPRLFESLARAHASPLEALRAYADCIAAMGESPGTLAHHLAYLQLDLTDPELYHHAREMAKAAREGIRHLLDDAVAGGELAPLADSRALARAIQVTLSGSLLTWAFFREGTAGSHLRSDLETLLKPYLGTSRKLRRGSRGYSRSRGAGR